MGQMCFLFWCLRGGRKRGLEFGASRRLFRTSENSAGTESEGGLTEPNPMRKERDETQKKRGWRSREGKREKGGRRQVKGEKGGRKGEKREWHLLGLCPRMQAGASACAPTCT